MTLSSPPTIKTQLERLYERYNRRQWVHPDPLEFLYEYSGQGDREVMGVIASSLAYGRVCQILKSVDKVRERMGPSPHRFVMEATSSSLRTTFRHFKHRFTSGEELAMLLEGLGHVISRYGSLYNCFLSGFSEEHRDILPALSALVRALSLRFRGRCNSLLPSPEKGSACKRLNLFMRWMVRRDRVDPGGWYDISPEKLIVPLDTHMHRIGLSLGLTRRKNADMRTALEITRAFRSIAPEDPVRYDFALTRFGIRSDLHRATLFMEDPEAEVNALDRERRTKRLS